MRKNRTKADKEISRLLHNVRNKVYRLRKAGASEEQIAAVDPRLSDYGMSHKLGGLTNGSQKAAYMRQLQNFVSRDNSLKVAKNGDIIPANEVKAYKAAEREANKAKKQAGKHILRVGGKNPEFYMAGGTHEDINSWNANIRLWEVYKQVYPVHHTEPFGSRKAALEAIEAQKQAVVNARNWDKRLINYRASIINRLYENGNFDLMKRVQGLSNEQFEYMALYTNLNEVQSFLFYVSDIVGNDLVFVEGIQTNMFTELEDLLNYIPQKIAPGGKNSLRSKSLKNYKTKYERSLL